MGGGRRRSLPPSFPPTHRHQLKCQAPPSHDYNMRSPPHVVPGLPSIMNASSTPDQWFPSLKNTIFQTCTESTPLTRNILPESHQPSRSSQAELQWHFFLLFFLFIYLWTKIYLLGKCGKHYATHHIHYLNYFSWKPYEVGISSRSSREYNSFQEK